MLRMLREVMENRDKVVKYYAALPIPRQLSKIICCDFGNSNMDDVRERRLTVFEDLHELNLIKACF